MSARANARRRCRDAVAHSDSDSALLVSSVVSSSKRDIVSFAFSPSRSMLGDRCLVLKIILKEGKERERANHALRAIPDISFFSSLA